MLVASSRLPPVSTSAESPLEVDRQADRAGMDGERKAPLGLGCRGRQPIAERQVGDGPQSVSQASRTHARIAAAGKLSVSFYRLLVTGEVCEPLGDSRRAAA